jgi:hypothetical protein
LAKRPSRLGTGHVGAGRGAARAPRAQGYCGRHPAAGQFCGQVRGSLRALRGAGGDSAGAEFDLIFRPAEADSEAPERSITAPETEIGYYQKDSLLLEDVLREQVLLSLPVRTLCKPDCKGLCPRCGENRNSQACNLRRGSERPPLGGAGWAPRPDQVLRNNPGD